MNKPIYLDHNATTPLDPRVLEAMLPYFKEQFGNPASRSHAYGWEANMAVEKSRKSVAQTLGASSKEIVFTSGATESTNLAVLGVAKHYLNEGCHIITTAVEHKANLLVCQEAERVGADLTVLDVDEHGRVSAKDIEAAINPNTRVVSLIMANNEIGTINPVAEIGEVTRRNGVWLHVDAAQSAGKIPIDVKAMKVDLLSISGHKIYGPKGVGALFINKEPEVPIEPISFGGDQEQGIRPGTLNVPGVVGLARALEIAQEAMNEESARLRELRDELIAKVRKAAPQVRLNGHPTERLCNNISFSFPNLSSDLFALGLSGLAVSSGSACSSGDANPSHVLRAIGHSDDLARSTVRVGLGRFTTREEILVAAEKFVALVEKNKEIQVT